MKQTGENTGEPLILVLEDEPTLRNGLRRNLEAEGFRVEDFDAAEAALDRLLGGATYALAIVDIGLAGAMDGLSFCRSLREQGRALPVLMLTARGELPDRLAGFEAGADDYLPKPFDLEELLARTRACLRRGPTAADRWRIGEFLVDPQAFSVRRADGAEGPVRLNEREMRILTLLVQNRGRPVSRDEILDSVWGQEEFPTNRTIDNYIVKFRKIFEPDPRSPVYFLTRHGLGYELAG